MARRGQANEVLPQQPLPRGILACLERQPRPRDGDNFGLWLDKYLPLDPVNYELKKERRDTVLRGYFTARDLGRPRSWRSTATCEYLARQSETCKLLYRAGHYLEFTATLNGRLIIDFARLSTLESGLSWHATLGVPRIPGSALKGLLRAALRPEIPADQLRELFGAPDLEQSKSKSKSKSKSSQTEHTRGRLVLHDALPEDGEFQLGLDVLTPHFSDYYGGKGNTAPADWLSPVPQTFLTVVKTSFRVVIGLLPPLGANADPAPTATAKLLKIVEDALKEAMRIEGLGAKRAVGYGRFVLTSRPEYEQH